MLVVTVACVTSLLAQGQSAVSDGLTYRTPPKAAHSVLAEISRLGGRNLTVTPALADEVLQIDVRDMPLKTLLGHVATVTGGRWEEVSSGLKLLRDEALVRKEEAAAVAGLARAIEAKLSEQRKAMSRPFTLADVREIAEADRAVYESSATPRIDLMVRREKLYENLPIARALVRLVGTIGSAQLASAVAGRRIVYSTHPTRMQRPLGPAGLSILRTYVQEQALFSARPDAGDGDPSAHPASMALGAQPAKCLLIARDLMGTLILELKVASADGTILGEHMLNASVWEQPEATAGASKLGARENTVPDPPKEFEELHKLVRPDQQGGLLRRVSPRALELLLNPETHEPLDWTVGHYFSAFAAGRQLVANIPDSCFFSSSLGAKPGTAGFMSYLKGIVRVEEGSDFVLVSPHEFRRVMDRSPRSALGKLLRASVSPNFSTLEDLSAYVGSSPAMADRTAHPMLFYLMVVLDPHIAQSLVHDLEMLRFWSTLGPSQRRTLQSSRPISIGSLTPAQFRLVEEMVFSEGASLEFTGDMGEPDLGEAMSGSVPTAIYGSLRSEPTEALPFGLPRTGTVQVAMSLEPILWPAQHVMLGGSALTASDAAYAMFMEERPDLFPPDPDVPKVRTYRPGSRTLYSFTFQLTRDLSMVHQLTDVRLAGEAMAFGALPAAFRQKVMSHLEELRKQMSGVNADPPADRTPPPPSEPQWSRASRLDG